jgi:hypothetical protein
MGVKGLLSHVLTRAKEEDEAAKAAGQGELNAFVPACLRTALWVMHTHTRSSFVGFVPCMHPMHPMHPIHASIINP